MASNTSLAEFNLSKQPELQEGKQILKELSEKGNKLCISVKEKLEEISMYSHVTFNNFKMWNKINNEINN